MKRGSMTLRELLGDPGVPDVALTGLSEDSRTVDSGDAFVAVRGASADGHDYAAHAVGRGAVCVLSERELPDLGVPVVTVGELRERRGALAARFYGEPSRAMRCVGVTGTNGKTSIAHHIADLAGGLGQRAGYLGTLGWGEIGRLMPAALTTADAIATQRRLACLRQRGCAWACLEASSHALAQGRVDDVRFESAVFSNLTRDHLDYHADFAAYGAAKRRLFEFPTVRLAVINVDDAFGGELAAGLDGPEVITVGRNGGDLSLGPGEFSRQWGERPPDQPLGNRRDRPARVRRVFPGQCRRRDRRSGRGRACLRGACRVCRPPHGGSRAHGVFQGAGIAHGGGRLRAHARCP